MKNALIVSSILFCCNWLNNIGATNIAYITNATDNSINVIDTESNTLLRKIELSKRPHNIAVTNDDKFAYIIHSESNSVSVVDLHSKNAIETLKVGNKPSYIAIAPDNKKVYVLNSESHSITVIDTDKNSVTASIKVQKNPQFIFFSPDSHKAYVTSAHNDHLYIIDTSTNSVSSTPRIGSNLSYITFNSSGDKAYIISGKKEGKLSILETASDRVINSFSVGNNPSHLAITPDGQNVYVTNKDSHTVSVYTTQGNIHTIQLPGNNASPVYVAISPDGEKAYIANAGNGTVNIIDITSNQVCTTYVLPLEKSTNLFAYPSIPSPSFIVLSSDGKKAYIMEKDKGTLNIVNIDTNTLEPSDLKVNASPNCICVLSLPQTQEEQKDPKKQAVQEKLIASASSENTLVDESSNTEEETSAILVDQKVSSLNEPEPFPLAESVEKFRRFKIEGGVSYFLPISKELWNIFGGGENYKLSLSSQIAHNIDLWAGANYFCKNGLSLNGDQKVKIQIIPINLGLKYFFPILKDEDSVSLDLYLNGAFKYYFLKVHNYTTFVPPHINRNGLGGVFGLGSYLTFSDILYLDFSIDYSFKTFGSEPSPPTYQLSSANVGGWDFGLGIGFKF